MRGKKWREIQNISWMIFPTESKCHTFGPAKRLPKPGGIGIGIWDLLPTSQGFSWRDWSAASRENHFASCCAHWALEGPNLLVGWEIWREQSSSGPSGQWGWHSITLCSFWQAVTINQSLAGFWGEHQRRQPQRVIGFAYIRASRGFGLRSGTLLGAKWWVIQKSSNFPSFKKLKQ